MFERKINRMMALNDSGKKNQQETNDIQDSGMDIEDGVREEDKNGIRNILLRKEKFITLMSLPLFKTSIFR